MFNKCKAEKPWWYKELKENITSNLEKKERVKK